MNNAVFEFCGNIYEVGNVFIIKSFYYKLLESLKFIMATLLAPKLSIIMVPVPALSRDHRSQISLDSP